MPAHVNGQASLLFYQLNTFPNCPRYLHGKRYIFVFDGGMDMKGNIADFMFIDFHIQPIGKGIGFGRKVSERIEVPEECTVYSLHEQTQRGSAAELVKSIDPVFLEITEQILKESEKVFGKIDWAILFPMADHIAFAVKRIRNKEQISNPLTGDIRALFHMEYKTAQRICPILKERLDVEIRTLFRNLYPFADFSPKTDAFSNKKILPIVVHPNANHRIMV